MSGARLAVQPVDLGMAKRYARASGPPRMMAYGPEAPAILIIPGIRDARAQGPAYGLRRVRRSCTGCPAVVSPLATAHRRRLRAMGIAGAVAPFSDGR
jgi:hypothetical protein